MALSTILHTALRVLLCVFFIDRCLNINLHTIYNPDATTRLPFIFTLAINMYWSSAIGQWAILEVSHWLTTQILSILIFCCPGTLGALCFHFICWVMAQIILSCRNVNKNWIWNYEPTWPEYITLKIPQLSLVSISMENE